MRLNVESDLAAGVSLLVKSPEPTDGARSASDVLLRLTASENLVQQATGWFAKPSSPVKLSPDPATSAPRRYLGFSFAQFAMPVVGSPHRPFDWNPSDNVLSPPVVLPLIVDWADDTVSLLAPLDSWHEQIIAVDQDDAGVHGFRWGWQGDLDRLPAATSATLGIFHAPTVSMAFDHWVAELVAHRGRPLPDRPADPITTHLSYWTDNGAAYWYRHEPGYDLAASVVDKITELDELGLTVRSVELDSWFYPHEITQPVAALAPTVAAEVPPDQGSGRNDTDNTDKLRGIPPTGMLAWEPRADVLPDGVAGFQRQVEDRPLILHTRHISEQSPYLEYGEWWTDYGAHPSDPAFFERWFDDAKAWGATCIEQDWMLLIWFGIGPIRHEPGRALRWQQAFDRFAAERDLTLLWCMATPADFLATVELNRLCAVRTSEDYRYTHDRAQSWRWYLTVNRLATALNLPVSKDCFFTQTDPGPSGHDGDPHAEVESLLAGLSGGVVGLGDRLGCTDPSIVHRLCRPDGLLVGSDAPLALTDGSFFDCGVDRRVTWAETHVDQPAGRWRYVLALNLADPTAVNDPGDSDDTDDAVEGRLALDEPALVYNWRDGTAEVADAIDLTLPHHDWQLFVCCPLLTSANGNQQGEQKTNQDDATAVIGAPQYYATASTSRLTVHADGTVDIIWADGDEHLSVRRWAPDRGLVDQTFTNPNRDATP